MAKSKPAIDAAKPPQPTIYTIELKVPIQLIAFRQQDAVGRIRQLSAALGALLDAAAPEAFVLGEGTLTVRSREPLPLAR
jgi:hypothetical protein